MTEMAALKTVTEAFGMFVMTLSMALLDVAVTRVGVFTDQINPKEFRMSRSRWIRGIITVVKVGWALALHRLGEGVVGHGPDWWFRRSWRRMGGGRSRLGRRRRSAGVSGRCRGDCVVQPLAEDLSTTRAEGLSTTRAEDLSTTRAEDLSTTRAEDLSTTRAEDLSTTRAEGLSTTRAEDLSTTRAEGLSTNRAEDLLTTRAEDLSTNRAEDLLTTRAEDLSTNRAEDLFTTRAEDLLTTRDILFTDMSKIRKQTLGDKIA
ncbi:hypothetical protein J6590_040460 [Homalodisca vitripennis]|nr:hypothetical protein J6590_040460 [Homalodisca vitripennis]